MGFKGEVRCGWNRLDLSLLISWLSEKVDWRLGTGIGMFLLLPLLPLLLLVLLLLLLLLQLIVYRGSPDLASVVGHTCHRNSQLIQATATSRLCAMLTFRP